MSRLLTLSAMLLVLAIFGCGPSEESKTEQGSKETTTEKMTESAKSAVEEVKEMASAVADKAVEMEEKAEPAIKEAAPCRGPSSSPNRWLLPRPTKPAR